MECDGRSLERSSTTCLIRKLPNERRMAFDLRRLFIIEVVAIALIVLSLASIAYVLFSMWTKS